MKNLESIIVVGSSGAGKTTLVNGVRSFGFANKVVVPRRYITRPRRTGDDLIENSHLNVDEFQNRVSEGRIWPFWSRELEAGRIESYGFRPVDEGDDRLRVYSANNAFLRDQNESVFSVLQDSLIVVAMARPEARRTRLGDRSPDMSSAERAIRLSDSGADMLESWVRVEEIETTNLTPQQGQWAFRRIVNMVLQNSI
jgi:ribose 1,5-bisphosphokinase PhnN